MLTIIAYGALAMSIIALLLALLKYRQFYWLAAFGIYIFSFLSGFSIGQLTVGLTFVFLALAIMAAIHDTRTIRHYSTYTAIGLLVGTVAVLYVDDYWLFYPFWLIIGS